MPRYSSDTCDAKGFHRDEFGDDYPSPAEAMTQAQAILGSIARDEMSDGEDHKVACEVRDETDALIYRGELTYQGARF